MNQEQKARFIADQANWSRAKPRRLPRPTYWPFFFAMGLMFLVWGLLMGWIIGITGIVILTIALTGWITELRHESRTDKRKSGPASD